MELKGDEYVSTRPKNEDHGNTAEHGFQKPTDNVNMTEDVEKNFEDNMLQNPTENTDSTVDEETKIKENGLQKPTERLDSTADEENGIQNQTDNVNSTRDIGVEQKLLGETSITIQADKAKRLHYKISETPPLHLTLVFGLQQGLISVAGFLSVTLLVSELVCAKDNELIKSKILSSTMFMSGLTTLLMVTIGVRLPVFQGPTSIYIIPLLALTEMAEWQCPSQEQLADLYANSTSNVTLNSRGQLPMPTDVIYDKLCLLMGSLMLVGVVHALIGATGLVGVLLRFIGPITIVPAITLIGLYIYETAVKFSETQWGVAICTSGLGIIFALYMRNMSTPLPAWSSKRGFHVTWFPFHQVFAVLLAIVISWGITAILTATDAISDDPLSVSFYARTDSRTYVITESSWFYFPYPGQFGLPKFSVAAFITFMMATAFSVLDSIGDYSACSRMCFVPPPPTHAVNRGIAVEGVMSFLAGTIGIGHATASYGNNIGVIGLTKVASRRVFQMTGLIFMLMAVIGKIGAFFVTIPYCVVGGAMILGLGNFIGIVLSNLQYIDLNSSRNLAIVGISLLLGLMLPFWIKKNPDGLGTGNEDADRLLSVMLSNPSCVGGLIACFLDNTVPGTKEERGLHIWQEEYTEADAGKSDLADMFEEGPEVYELPFVPKSFMRSKYSRFVPFVPSYYKKVEKDRKV